MKNYYPFVVLAFMLSIFFFGCEQSNTGDTPVSEQPVQEDVFDKAMEQFKQGDYEKAIILFTQAAKDSDNPAIYCNRASCYSYLNQFEAAMKDYDTAIKKAIEFSNDPNDSRLAYLYYNRGYANDRGKKYEQAISDYEKTIALNGEYPDVKNQLAWILATCYEQRLRAPQRAVNLAEAECKRTNWKNGGLLDTLAAAHASAGDFAKAVERQKQAVKLTVKPEIKKSFSERLELYRKNKPFIESAVHD